MKFSTSVLPLLSVAAKEKDTSERSLEPHEFFRECSKFVKGGKGTFQATGEGAQSGEVRLENYGNRISCKQVITADSNCQAIEVRYRSVVVEKCCDYAQLGYTRLNDLKLSPEIRQFYGSQDWPSNFGWQQPGSRGVFFVDSNSFNFYFHSDQSINGGEVIMEWNCIDEYATTTTATTTTTTTTTTRPDWHPGMQYPTTTTRTTTLTTTSSTIPPWHPGMLDYGTTTTT